MRKLIVCTIVSLDGYSEGSGRDVMAMPMDHAFDNYNAERLRAADTLLLGRNTYLGFKSFWPHQADNPDPELVKRLTGQEERLETVKEISRLQNVVEKVVISDTLTADQTRPWQDTTRIVRRADAHERIADLKRGAGRDILIFGSRTLWNDLLAAGLVDELHLMVGSVVLGEGTRAFDPEPANPLRLLGTCAWNGSDNVLLRYATTTHPHA